MLSEQNRFTEKMYEQSKFTELHWVFLPRKVLTSKSKFWLFESCLLLNTQGQSFSLDGCSCLMILISMGDFNLKNIPLC